MSNSINSDALYNCVGCGLCSKICPENAIQFITNAEGFINARINDEKCINCGLCKKVCPKFYESNSDYDINKAEAYYGNSLDLEVMHKATSGGIVHEIAKLSISNGVKVIGVAYDYEENIAKHIIVNKEEDLFKIIGSKYLQSKVHDVLPQINHKDKYLFIGTPCQCYALRKYIKLKNIEDNFILIDFFCHGHSSQITWDKYIKESGFVDIEEVEFRSKVKGWHNFVIHIKDKNKNYYGDSNSDNFLKLFLANSNILKGCYTCNFRYNEIYADIRVADFWGRKFWNNQDGVSMILSLSKKGSTVLTELHKNASISKIDYEEIYTAKQGKLKGIKQIPIYRDQVIEQLQSDKTLKEIAEFVNKKTRTTRFVDEVSKRIISFQERGK